MVVAIGGPMVVAGAPSYDYYVFGTCYVMYFLWAFALDFMIGDYV